VQAVVARSAVTGGLVNVYPGGGERFRHRAGCGDLDLLNHRRIPPG
jgi:hypothetical protein